MKKFLLLIPILFLLTGCYNYRELNDLAIVSGISIDKEGEEYILTAEVVNPKKETDASSGKEPGFIIYTSKGKSLQEAFRKVVKESPKKLYGGQIDILIIDEDTAKSALNSIMDFFARDPEVRSEFYVLIGKSENVLEITTPLINISSQNILNSLESSNKYFGTANLITYHELINNYLNEKQEIALPTIETIGNEETGQNIENMENTTSESTSIISNMAVFKNNKLKGYLTEQDSIFYNLVMSNTQTFLVRSEYGKDEYIINEVIEASSNMDANVKKKKITISIEGKAAISEVNYKCNLDEEKTIEKIQKKLNEDIEKKVKSMIKTVQQEYNSDIFGFQDLFYKTDVYAYKEFKDDWYNNIFKELEIDVKSNVTIFEKGNLIGGIFDEKK